MKNKPASLHKAALIAAAALVLVSGPACAVTLFRPPGNFTPPPPTAAIPTATPLPTVQVIFHASLAAPLAPGETLVLRVLDEVSGLTFHSADYPMAPRDALNYTAALPLAPGSVLKYRYARLGPNQTEEITAHNLPVRYRMYYVAGAAETTDLIAGWADRPFAGKTGDIQGAISNAQTGAPIPNLLVSAGGLQSLTDSAGRFNLHGLPVGTHTVVVYALDGGYAPFQQGASVAEGLSTPVEARLTPAALVPVSFTVHVPENTQPGAPVRIAGNLLQLGNTFADLRGGLSLLADRMPIMKYAAEGVYNYIIYLPVGADVRYKYTLGDGYWNAERTADGDFHVRQFIVPPGGAYIEERVASWQSGPSAPISFEVTVPPDTPAGEIVYIQFNSYGWSEPIPMWSARDNVWKYKLYGPLNFKTLHYRYCRNGQCGAADDAATPGDSAAGYTVETALFPQDIRDTVTRWAWMGAGPATLVGSGVLPRPGGFMAGIEFQSNFHPNWIASISQAMQNVQALGANWVILTPTWTFDSANPILFGTHPGLDPLWSDAAIMITQGRALGLNVGVFPRPRFAPSLTDAPDSSGAAFWRLAARDQLWWQMWFEAYRAFAVHHADLAAQNGAQALILGGEWLGPALPNGTLADGSPSGVPADAEARWLSILNEVRARFRGQVLWAIPYTVPNLVTPAFLTQTDGVYLMISGHLSQNLLPSKQELESAAASLLDNSVAPLQSLLGKPVYLAFAYPSVNGGAANCLPSSAAPCLDWTALNQPAPDRAELTLNLQLQADIYETLLAAVNTRPWVSGVVSRGYYPPTLLQDKSASVHGKYAADVLWYWYQRFLGIVR